MVTEIVEYNVCCISCGAVFQPPFHSPLWWKAHKHATEHPDIISAMGVSGEECGCVRRILSPDAPYRLLDHDFDGWPIDVPLWRFTDAIKAFRTRQRCGFPILVGVSRKVEARLGC